MLANSKGSLALVMSALMLGIFVPVVSSRTESTLTSADAEPLEGVGDNMVFSVRRNGTFVVSMKFVTGGEGQAVTHRLNPDGSTTFVGSSPAGRENRAIAMVRDGNYAVIVNSLDDEIRTMAVGSDGTLSPVGSVSSGGDNPFDAAAIDNMVMVVNRDSDQLTVFSVTRRGDLIASGNHPTGFDPHVVSVSRRFSRDVPESSSVGGEAVRERVALVAVGNQTGQSISLFRLNKAGEMTSLGDIPLGKTPRALSWLGQTLFVALDEPGAPAPGTSEDAIRPFEISVEGEVSQGPDTPAGHFLTDIEATKKGLFAVTVNQNGAAPDRDEVRVYTIDGMNLTLDASVQPNDAFPSFKQVATIKGTKPVDQHVLVTEFQAGVLRSLVYDKQR